MPKETSCPNSCVRFDHATHVESLSLHALRAPSVPGPTCALLSCGCGIVPHSSCPLAQRTPPFLHPCRLSTLALIPVPDPLPSLLLGTVARTPPRRANPIPILPRSSSRRGATWLTFSPSHDPPVILFPRPPLPRALHCHLRPPSYKMPPCAPLFHPHLKSEVEIVEWILSISAQVGEAQEAVEKEAVGGRATRPSCCS
jgi:hypothetical protein